MKNKKNSKNINTGFQEAIKKQIFKFDKCDKASLVSSVTGCIFILFALIQLFFVLFSPAARTFDHFSLIMVDFIIAALCFVYVLYRRGLLANLGYFSDSTVPDKSIKNDSRKKSSSSGDARVCIPAGKTNGASRRISSQSDNHSGSKHDFDEENENLFSPRHRYSGNRPANTRSQSTQEKR